MENREKKKRKKEELKKVFREKVTYVAKPLGGRKCTSKKLSVLT